MPRRTLITEREIRRLVAEGRRDVDVSGAAITPSGIDLARRLGLVLKGLPHEGRLRRTKGRPVSPEGVAPAPTTAGHAAAPSSGNVQASSAPPATARGRAPLRIALGADHGGVGLKDRLVGHLREAGHLVTDHGTHGTNAVDYPDFALLVARSVAAGAAEFGIIVDGAGIGSCMVANKVRGVRAALCHDITTALNAREHNNANVLTLGGGLTGERLALAIVEAFLATPFAGGRHGPRVAKIDALLP